MKRTLLCPSLNMAFAQPSLQRQTPNDADAGARISGQHSPRRVHEPLLTRGFLPRFADSSVFLGEIYIYISVYIYMKKINNNNNKTTRKGFGSHVES